MAFQIKRRGKLTYYYRADRPVFSFVVTEALPDGDLRVYLAGLTGGESATRNLGLADLATMDPDREIPRVFQTWEAWLKEAGVCDAITALDFVEMHVFGCQPKSPHPLADPAGYAAEVARLRQAYGRAYAAFFRDHLPEHGLPVRFTVHVIDVPDPAASYEFYTTALLQRAPKEQSG
jgi:hypothetical protein